MTGGSLATEVFLWLEKELEFVAYDPYALLLKKYEGGGGLAYQHWGERQ